MMAARLASQHLSPVDVVGDCRLGRQRTGLVDRRIDILPLPRDRSVDQRGHDGHVGEMTAHVPGIAATGSDGRRIRHVRLVIAAGGHLAARRHVQQVAGEVVPPGAGLAEGGQRAHDQPGVLLAESLVIEPQGRQEARPEGFQNDVRCRRQTREKLASVCGFQIEGDAAFGRVVVPEGQAALRMGDVVEEWPDTAAALAAGRFDLDHIGPEVAEKLAAELALFIRELQDSQACQRARQGLGIGHRSISSI